jgi:hypothetical protein
MNDSEAGRARENVFSLALCGTRDALRAQQTSPSDVSGVAGDPNVTDVVFVVHGIRDTGYWTRKIAQRIKSVAEKRGDGVRMIVATQTSTYGYFPMLPFLLPSKRRQKVEWLMDRYAEALAQYPNARFSFVGHSNGTYLLAKALEEYSSVELNASYLLGALFAESMIGRR